MARMRSGTCMCCTTVITRPASASITCISGRRSTTSETWLLGGDTGRGPLRSRTAHRGMSTPRRTPSSTTGVLACARPARGSGNASTGAARDQGPLGRPVPRYRGVLGGRNRGTGRGPQARFLRLADRRPPTVPSIEMGVPPAVRFPWSSPGYLHPRRRPPSTRRRAARRDRQMEEA